MKKIKQNIQFTEVLKPQILFFWNVLQPFEQGNISVCTAAHVSYAGFHSDVFFSTNIMWFIL